MKKILFLLASALLLACTCSVPFSLARPTPTSQVDNLHLSGLTIVRLHPDDGDLLAQLKSEAPKASALGQHMFVEFDASW